MSLFKKIKSIYKNGTEPIERGVTNYKLNISEVEELALERLETCKGCDLFIEEPISFLKIGDGRIVELSNMMCDDCGCASPYLLRQSIKICKKWKR